MDDSDSDTEGESFDEDDSDYAEDDNMSIRSIGDEGPGVARLQDDNEDDHGVTTGAYTAPGMTESVFPASVQLKRPRKIRST